MCTPKRSSKSLCSIRGYEDAVILLSNSLSSDLHLRRMGLCSDFVDVNIGYQFVNILYRNNDGSLGVDVDLVNDVREQHGGGGEMLIVE